MDREKYLLFIAGYFACMLAALGVMVAVLDSAEWWGSVPLFAGAVVFGLIWYLGRRSR